MGKLFLASFTYETENGVRTKDYHLVVASISDDYTEHQKALMVRDWAIKWFENKHKKVNLVGARVHTTLQYGTTENKQSPVGVTVSLSKGANGNYFLFGDTSATGPMTSDELAEHLFEEMASGKLVMIQQ